MSLSHTQANPLETDPGLSLVRPIDSRWVLDTTNVINHTASGHGTFHPKHMPGITYVSKAEFHTIAGEPGHADVERIQEQTEVVLGSMAADPELGLGGLTDDMTATPFDMWLDLRTGRLRLRLRDPASPDYESGYRIDGEKTAVRKEFGLRALEKSVRSRPYAVLGHLRVQRGRTVNAKALCRDILARARPVVPLLGLTTRVEPVQE